MSGEPEYQYIPNFTPSDNDCVAPVYKEKRSRLFAGGTYFRSIKQGILTNKISISCVTNNDLFGEYKLLIYNNSILVETFKVNQVVDFNTNSCLVSGITQLRPIINNYSKFIEMPARLFDVNDLGEDSECLSSFNEQYLIGGDGPPDIVSFIDNIRTGPSITLIIIKSVEDERGDDVQPPSSKISQQWNGIEWVPYYPFI